MKPFKPIFISLMLSMIFEQVNAQWEMLSDVYTTEVFVKDNNIFIGTNEGNILLSSDFGQSWTSIKNNLPDLFIDNIGICEGNKLICSCGRFIYTSSKWLDWEKVYEVQSNITAMIIEGDSIYIGAEYYGGIHASFDNGITWSDISENLQNRYITSVAVEDTTLMISVFSDPQIFRFDNNFQNWDLFNEGTEIDQIYSLGKGDDFFAGGYSW